MDYSKMSDHEINKAVAEIAISGDWLLEPTDESPSWFVNHGMEGKNTVKLPDYCNNAADAWPIILKHRISISFDESNEGDEAAEWVTASADGDEHFSGYLKCGQALRAAMIVYLQLQEAK